MRDICAGAFKALVWLGEATPGSNRAMTYFGKTATTLTKVSWSNYEHSKPASKGLRETLLRKFFSPVWIVLGVIVSDTVGAVCGKKCLSFYTLTMNDGCFFVAQS